MDQKICKRHGLPVIYGRVKNCHRRYIQKGCVKCAEEWHKNGR